jgi:Ca2+-binding EF-hand superfamily protein
MSAMSSQVMKERHEKRLKKMMRKLDKNEDGQISFEEMQSMRKGKSPERMIERFDDNDDGQISAEEYAKMENKMQKRKGKNKDHGKDKD